MSLVVPPRRFDPAAPEMMDRPGHDPAVLREDLRVLEQINQRLGGHQIPLRYLPRLLARHPDPLVQFPVTAGTGRSPTAAVRILDLGSGGADVPRAIAVWARARGLSVHIRAVDANPQILAIAREWSAHFPEIRFEQHDLRALPWPAASFDIVLCSLTLHHFAEADAVEILRRIRDIARVGYIVNDLRRSRAAIWTSKLMAATIITNPIARYDAPLSCERAFTVAELRRMAQRAGLRAFAIRRHRWFRMALAGTR
jgi:SAM-dependent methyltransferase